MLHSITKTKVIFDFILTFKKVDISLWLLLQFSFETAVFVHCFVYDRHAIEFQFEGFCFSINFTLNHVIFVNIPACF